MGFEMSLWILTSEEHSGNSVNTHSVNTCVNNKCDNYQRASNNACRKGIFLKEYYNA